MIEIPLAIQLDFCGTRTHYSRVGRWVPPLRVLVSGFQEVILGFIHVDQEHLLGVKEQFAVNAPEAFGFPSSALGLLF